MHITKTNLTHGPQLGSQMGQFAGLYAIAKQLNFDIKFFDEYIQQGRGPKLFEAFDLDHLRASIYNTPPIQSTYSLKDVILDSTVFSLSNQLNWDIQGWFHLYHYWHEYRSDLLNIFKFKHNIYSIAYDNILKIKSNEHYPIIALHVRRGDYLQVSSLNLTLDYYNEAINIFLERFVNIKLIIFSDDIEWCKQNIVGDNVVYSEGNSNLVDMCMMSLCDHNIIANSTFSWWAAYLNENIDKVVVCPSNYAGESDVSMQFINKNYYPVDWIAL